MTASAGGAAPRPADVWLVLRDRLAWAIAASLGVLAGVLAVQIDERPGLAARVAFTAIPVVVLAGTLALTLRRGAILATGALALAVTPAALAAVAAGAQWGAAAVLVGCGAVLLAWWGRDRATIAVTAAVVTIVGIAAWAASTPNELSTPTWGQVTKRTGEMLWSGIGSLDTTLNVPATGWLIWWVAAGLVTGAALVVGAIRVAVVIPLAAAVMIVAGLVIFRWRGDVDMSGGVWIIGGAVAYAGASVRFERAVDRRFGTTLLVIAGFIWVVAIIQLARN